MRKAAARCVRSSREIESVIPLFQWQPKRMLSDNQGKDKITINWKNKDGSFTATQTTIGSNLLSVALEFKVDLGEGGCKGNCGCSTCHVILEDEVYDSLEEPSEEEENMLDAALDLTTTSRLGCQVCIGKEHDGILVTLPLTYKKLSKIEQANYL